jgi:hypothetical protein
LDPRREKQQERAGPDTAGQLPDKGKLFCRPEPKAKDLLVRADKQVLRCAQDDNRSVR